jgi:hypothetical protein
MLLDESADEELHTHMKKNTGQAIVQEHCNPTTLSSLMPGII